ncbi:class I SAM-dependent methyltransferase [Gymnodinialimonas sp.]
MKNWDELAAPWLKAEARMEAAHRPVLDAMLEKADLQTGHSVLDIGIGSGLSTALAAEAVGQGAGVTGVDVAPPFIARAAERMPDGVTLLEADAETHDFSGAGFERAISLFGTMFFGDTQAAFANLRRAMVPGGRFTFAAWAPPASNPWLSIGGQAANAVLGPPAERPDPNAPGPFRFALPDTALDALSSSGWQAEVETLDLTLLPTGTLEEITATQMALGVAASRIAQEEADAEEVEAIEDAIASRFRQMQNKAGAVLVPARIHFFTATA